MTEPQPEPVPLVDQGNQFLGPDYPASMVTGQVNTPGGPRLLITIRCGPASITVTMTRDAAKNWAATLDGAADGMSSLIVPPNGFKFPT